MKSEIDLSQEAAALDQVAAIDDAAGVVDTALNNATAPAAAPGRPAPVVSKGKKRGRKKGSGRKPASTVRQAGAAPENETATAASETAAADLPEDFLEQALSSAANNGLQLLKRSGWTSPATSMMTEEEFCRGVAHCLDAMRVKYMGESLEAYQEEAALILLVAPWAVQNLLRVLDERKSRRASRVNGIRKDTQDGGANSNGSAGDPSRSDDRSEQLRKMGLESIEPD